MDERSLQTLEFPLVLDLLAAETACSLGRGLALAARPTQDRQTAIRMQQETSEAADILSSRGNIPLGGISDIRPYLDRAAIGGVLEPSDLLDVASTVQSGRHLRVFLQKVGPDGAPTLMPLAGSIGQFPDIESAITRAIGPNGEVLDSASPELARVRSRRRSSEQRLVDRLNAFISGGQRSLLQEPVIVQRGDRSCLAVKAEHRGAFGGIVHDTSTSGATLFVEPAAVVEIGNEVRELEAAERRELMRILSELSVRVGRTAGAISATLSVLAKIDLIAARARLAQRQRAVKPQWNERGAVRLMSARHPLIEPDTVVAIDVIVGEPDESQIVIITGPNTGGKTATLKTVGLLTLMAQTGLHIPAARADMCCFAEVFADIGDDQSIQQSLSTFSGHITTIARFLTGLVPDSLVLLDEIGAGTDPAEGAALAVALLEFFRERGARVVATSHYGELKTYAFTTSGVQNASVEFDLTTLRPTYRVIQGVPGSSNAHAIAGRLGIPDGVIGRAVQALTGSNASVEIMQELESARRQALDDRAAAEELRREAEELRGKADIEAARFERTRADLRAQVLSELREVVRSTQSKANDLLREIRDAREQATAEESRTRVNEIETNAVSEIESLLDIPEEPAYQDAEDAAELCADDRVRISPLGLVGRLMEDVRGRDRVAVQVGSVRLSVEAEALTRVVAKGSSRAEGGPAFKTRAARIDIGRDDGAAGIDAAAAISGQLTLIGHRADEARDMLERYLYDASAAGLDRVRIVHGKGTGVLRRVVQEYLHGNSLIARFDTAGPEEGGAGATVAHMADRG